MLNIIDKSNLKQVIQHYPEQFAKALNFSKNIKIKGNFSNIIVCGIGGSALPIDMVNCYLKSKNINFPVIINRTYNLPVETTNKSLVIASSYSGNTEETISCLKEALNRKLTVIGLSKGGEVEAICQKNQLAHIKYPEDGPTFQPRCGTGYAFTSTLIILSILGIVKNIAKELNNLIIYLNNINPKLEQRGKALAKKLKNKIPIIYTSDNYKDAIARIFKIKLNENSKTQSFYNYFPELNHNEMVGFTNLVGKYFCVILSDPQDHPRIIKRMEITKNIYLKKGIGAEIISMQGKNTLEKIFFSSLLADWTSYYLALEYNQDPTPVAMVEEFKDKIKK